MKFVSDTPSASIVNAVAAAYLKNRTAIKPTLRAMVDHPDFDAAPLGNRHGWRSRYPVVQWSVTL